MTEANQVRLVLALAIGLVGGFWGVVISFSDYPSGWSETRWLMYVLASHGAFGLAIGALAPRWWFLSLMAGWGVLSWGALGLITLWSSEFFLELVLPVLASLVVAGFLGSLLARLLGSAVGRVRPTDR